MANCTIFSGLGFEDSFLRTGVLFQFLFFWQILIRLHDSTLVVTQFKIVCFVKVLPS